MLNEHLAQLWTNVHSIEHASIRFNGSDAISKTDSILLKNGIFLLFGITLEKASAVLEESSFLVFKGRWLKLSAFVLKDSRGIYSFLTTLDEVEDIIISVISSNSSQFKAERLLSELHRCLTRWSADLWRALSPLFRSLIGTEISVDCVRFLRQFCNLLSKLHIDRPDLLADGISDYFESEESVSVETSVQTARSDEYWEMILSIRHELNDVVSIFDDSALRPGHGPGAVAIPKVKTRTQKYLNMGHDSRIDYLLSRKGEHMYMYSPFSLGVTDRTSRVIFVPKTWKKLRGISAEPSGLQFFQQGVNDCILRAISRTRMNSVIDLTDQSVSRKLALDGSLYRDLATIDLSAASDSVTLRLVKDIFGTSKLCRWLLATRSTHTLINNKRIRLAKFAPMGSACCFPVECLVFAGIVLATARRRSRSRELNYSRFRVYGDDIICPSSIAEDVIDNLILMGFTVNNSKSYWTGDYRESCGMDAWRGHDVTPLKIKDFSFSFSGTSSCTYDHHARITAYLSRLYFDGYKVVRSFLLRKFLTTSIRLGKSTISTQKSLVFGDGSRGTLASCQPDNFHLTRVPLKGYQRSGLQVINWKPRELKDQSHQNDVDKVNYFEWLLVNRQEDPDPPLVCDLSYFRSLDERLPGIREGQQMIPSVGTHDPWVPSVGA